MPGVYSCHRSHFAVCYLRRTCFTGTLYNLFLITSFTGPFLHHAFQHASYLAQRLSEHTFSLITLAWKRSMVLSMPAYLAHKNRRYHFAVIGN